MKNLDLLERHRRKVAFILAAITLVLMYASIAVFEFSINHEKEHYFSETAGFWLILIILAPFLYSILSFLACRMMHKVYHPIRESIMNLEQFTTNVNHELKTSLSEIISSLELWDLTKDYTEYNSKALVSAKRMNIILDTLIPMVEYTNSSYRKKSIDIVKVFEWIVSENTDEVQWKNISLKKDFPDSITSYIDIWPLAICFQNVLKNAIKYNKENGDIHITIGKDFFEIYDTGIWIEKENLDNIFTRNFQEKGVSEWLWVGLSLVKSICDKYNWDIDLTSEKGRFTCVKISF